MQKRYKGVAKVTCRRARKGFALKLNPDAHYSTAMYSGLNKLQKKDGTFSLLLNRDAAAGFRLDTTYTHRQHSVLSLSHDVDVTTRSDYVNKYSSTLQVSSYMFLETGLLKLITCIKNPLHSTWQTCVCLRKVQTLKMCSENRLSL